MSRALITGINGFVGLHLARQLTECGWRVYGFDQRVADDDQDVFGGDITDRAVLSRALKECKPDVVFHLAGILKSNRPEMLYQANLLGTVALFDSLMDVGITPVIIVASSSAVYGGGNGGKPMSELFEPYPVTHYAVSKLAQEYAALRYFNAFQLPVMIVRMFNLLGPGQSPDLACSAFARQIALAEMHGTDEIVTGDLSARRDFVDVRDAVQAFVQLTEKGAGGQIYNVCSGRAVTIEKCLDEMLSMSPRHLTVRQAAERIQTNDAPVQVGSARKLKQATGWRPQISLKQSLADLLNDWRLRIRSEAE